MDAELYAQFDQLEDAHWWFLGRREVVLATLRRLLRGRAGLRILDAGCGTGGMLGPLAEFGTVEGLELEPRAVEAARRRAGGAARVHPGGLPEGLPRGERYDLITALDVLEHIGPSVDALRALRSALAPGGTLVITVPAFPFLWSAHDEVNHHQRRYTRASLQRELATAGFAIRHLTHYNSLLFPPTAAVRLLQRVLPREGNPRSDLQLPPAPVNAALRTLFALERWWVPRLEVPFGLSLLAVATPVAEPG